MRKLGSSGDCGVAGLSFVDGPLGMALRTSTTLQPLATCSSALASTVVHISEAGMTLASGVSHWRFWQR